MKFVKKFTTLFLAITICLNFCGCFDKSWAIKCDEESLPTGIYVFYMMQSYQEATQKLSQDGAATDDISNATIDGQSAPNWIVEKSLNMCKKLLAVEKIFTDMSLTLTEDEENKAQKLTDSMWESSGTMLEKNYGINKDAVHRASSLYSVKLNKIFNSIYGKDGTNPVSDENLNKYYKETYLKLLFYSKMPTHSGESSDVNNSDSENKPDGENSENQNIETDDAIQNEMNSYADAINNGTKNLDQIRDEIKKSASAPADAANDPLIEQIINPNSSSLAPEIAEKIKNLEKGKAAVVTLNNVYFLIYNAGAPTEDIDFIKDASTEQQPETSSAKIENADHNPGSPDSIQENSDQNSENNSEQDQKIEESSQTSKRDEILYEMKQSELEEKINLKLSSMSFNINYNAVNQFNPLMFKLISA